MRTLDATLQSALATFHFVPYFKLKVYRNGALLTTLDVLKYKLTGTHLSVTTRGLVSLSTSPDNIKVVLERGIVQQGVAYVLDSSKFTPVTGSAERLSSKSMYVSTTIEAELIPPKYVTFDGSASYQDVITSFCTAIGKTPVFKDPGAALWSSQFMPNTTTITLNDARMFIPLLQQKRLIFACDNGGEQILFFCALDIPAGYDASINPVLYHLGTGYFSRRRYMATDENGLVTYAGTVGDELFNIGYKYDADPFPNIYSQAQPVEFTQPINLLYQDGDKFGIDGNSYSMYPARVTEIFDPKASPGWQVNVKQLQYFSETEGGSLPTGLAAKAPYMPVNTSMFNGVLGPSANNMQAAFDMLDDHHHAGGGAAGQIVANTTALTQVEGYLRWDSVRKLLVLWDAQRERGITPVGWLPYAFPIGFPINGTFSLSQSVAANGGSVAIPIILTAPMLLESVSIYDLDTANAHTFGWDLYEQYLNNGNAGENALTRVAASNGNLSYTASAIIMRTLGAAGAPVFLPPGVYWLVVQNRHATTTLSLGCVSTYNAAFIFDLYQTKTTANPNGAALDFVAATWTKVTDRLPAVRLNARVFGQAAAF